MSRSFVQKRIHYVRAVYLNPPGTSLEDSIRQALIARAAMCDTEMQHPQLGTLAVREKVETNNNFVAVAIGLCVPNELFGSMGIAVAEDTDKNVPIKAPPGRAFKLADAFCLIDDNEVLITIDGSMRLSAVNMYLSHLLQLADATPDAQAFELITKLDQDKANTLDAEGVKEISVKSTAFAVNQDQADQGGWLRSGFIKLVASIRQALEHEVETDEQRQALVAKWSELNITTTIKVAGGANGEEIVLKTLEDIGRQALEDSPEGMNITLVTQKNNPVSADQLVLSTAKSMKRLNQQNDLEWNSVLSKLVEYRQELKDSNRWAI
jgi:hypothetical protein